MYIKTSALCVLSEQVFIYTYYMKHSSDFIICVHLNFQGLSSKRVGDKTLEHD